MSDFSYDMPWRTNYEARATAAWFAAGTLTIVTMILVDLPRQPFWFMTFVSYTMMFIRLPAALELAQKKSGLTEDGLEFITHEQLYEKMLTPGRKKVSRKTPDEQVPIERQWIGTGFEWAQPHAQKAHEILKRDSRDFVPDTYEMMGVPWIHGLESQNNNVIDMPLSHAGLHTLILGTTGSGKTRLFDLLISQAIRRGEPVIIIDPKSDHELRENARRACEKMGSPERFVFMHPGFPDLSARINPLRNFNRGTELATRIAALIPSSGGGDPFQAFSQMALNNIVQGLLLVKSRPNLIDLRSFVENGPAALCVSATQAYVEKTMPDRKDNLDAALQQGRNDGKRAMAAIVFYREHIKKYHGNPDLEGLLSMYEHDRTHFSKMVASLMPILNMLTSGELGPMLSPNPDNLEDERQITDSASIINNAQVCYLGLDSLSDNLVGRAIGAIFLADLASVAGDRYNYGLHTQQNVNIFVDEAAEVICDQLIQLLNKGRGAGFRMYVASQSTPDFIAALGDESKAAQVLANINNQIVLRCTDETTQKYVTEILPKTKIKVLMRTQGTSTAGDPALHGGSVGERLSEEEADLFPPQLLGQLPNLDCIARISGSRIFKGRIPILVENQDKENA